MWRQINDYCLLRYKKKKTHRQFDMEIWNGEMVFCIIFQTAQIEIGSELRMIEWIEWRRLAQMTSDKLKRVNLLEKGENEGNIHENYIDIKRNHSSKVFKSVFIFICHLFFYFFFAAIHQIYYYIHKY